LTSCATRPYFAIENKSDNEIKIELTFDSLDLKKIVAKYIIDKSPIDNYTTVCYNNPTCDSIIQMLEVDKNLFLHYLYDSLTLSSFLLYSDQSMSPLTIGEFAIQKIGSSDNEAIDEKDRINFNQNIFDYYHYDSTLIQKIIFNKAITLFVPSNYMFLKQCHASGDASCNIGDAFPNSKEVRVVIAKDNVIILTKDNFKYIMKNKSVQRQSDSYLLEIE
jgi:hypothetical protein